MKRNYKAAIIYVLIGLYLLIVAAFLALAINQAINLISLYRVSVAPPSAIDAGNMGGFGPGFGSSLLTWLILAVFMFTLIFRYPRRLRPLSLIVVLIFIALNLFSGRHILPQLLVWPAPASISRQYLQALTTDDWAAAGRLTDQSAACETKMKQVFQDHQVLLKQQFGDNWQKLMIHDVAIKSISTFYDKPLPQGFVFMQPVPQQLFIIMAEMENSETIWLNLKMSYTPFWGTRYLCGQDVDLE